MSHFVYIKATYKGYKNLKRTQTRIGLRPARWRISAAIVINVVWLKARLNCVVRQGLVKALD